MPVGSGFKVGSVLDPYVRQFYAQLCRQILGFEVGFKTLKLQVFLNCTLEMIF